MVSSITISINSIYNLHLRYTLISLWLSLSKESGFHLHLLYFRLSGESPFLGDDKQQTYSNVSTGTYSFDHETFVDISSLAKDFISNLLQKLPR